MFCAPHNTKDLPVPHFSEGMASKNFGRLHVLYGLVDNSILYETGVRIRKPFNQLNVIIQLNVTIYMKTRLKTKDFPVPHLSVGIVFVSKMLGCLKNHGV